MIHEAIGIARGPAIAHFGGKRGRDVEIKSGDVVILPTGTGRRLVAHRQKLVVIGAYPPKRRYDLNRGSKAEHDRTLAAIPEVPPPAADAVFGPKGPLMKLWPT